MDPITVIAAAAVGVLVGLTGAGGGALMTPMLIVLRSVKPSVAIASDLVATVWMRPVGALVHAARGTVDLRLAAWLSAGSVPAAFVGAWVLHLVGRGPQAEHDALVALGAALLAGASGMAVRQVLDAWPSARGGRRPSPTPSPLPRGTSLKVRPTLTVAIGALAGFVVGFTSVGAGSLVVVMLAFAYPGIGASWLIGTDLAQAVPLGAAAALGAALFGHVRATLAAAVAVGGVPGVLVGALVSSRLRSDRFFKLAIAIVVLAAGLKDVGAGSVDVLAGSGLAAVAIGLVQVGLPRLRAAGIVSSRKV
jgi:uncharacterized membrane protein YfcA